MFYRSFRVARPSKAKTNATGTVQGQVYAAQHPRETELSERLCRLLPSSEVVRFATSGTEAVLMAFRLARAFTGRTKILKLTVRGKALESGGEHDVIRVANANSKSVVLAEVLDADTVRVVSQ